MAESTLYSLQSGTAAVLQASTQYTAGVLTGTAIDWAFLHWRVAPENIPARVLKLIAQAGLNGYALSVLLPWIHPRDVTNYSDPTGGYLLAFGLMQSQPNLHRNTKELVSSVLEIYEEAFFPTTKIESETEISPE